MTPPPALPRHPPEHFIPLRAQDLARLLSESQLVAEDEQSRFLNLCSLLKSILHFEYHEQLLRLKKAYAPFDPDADTVRLRWSDETEDPGLDADRFFDSLVTMFERANFRRMDRVQLQEAFAVSSEWGLNLEVDFSIFDRLEIFARGETVLEKSFRSWRNFYRLRTKKIMVHQRLVVAFRLRPGAEDPGSPPGSVVVKMFKDIPKGDLEMLLPGTRVRMTFLDRARIALPTISGLIVTIYRIVRGAMVLAFAGAYGLLGFLMFVGGTIGYGIKSFFGYLRTKDKYQADLTRNLYYQNMDNNAGVLFRLIDEVEEQEFREAIIAWTLLTAHNAPFGRTIEELDSIAEQMLFEATDIDVDFEADDALAKLQRLGLVTRQKDRYTAVPVAEALRRLDERWDRFFLWSNKAA